MSDKAPKKEKVSLKGVSGIDRHLSKEPYEVPEGYHGRILTLPNLITFFRALLLIPLFIFLRLGEKGHGNFWALFVIGVALLSDFFDGFLARVLKQETDWGRLFDPLIDKIWIAGLGIFLALPWRLNPLPWGFLVLVLIRDVLIIAAGIHAYKGRRIVLESNLWGKWAMFLTALTLVAYAINFQPPGRFPWVQSGLLLWMSVLFLVVSGLVYCARYIKLIRSVPTTSPASQSSPAQMDM